MVWHMFLQESSMPLGWFPLELSVAPHLMPKLKQARHREVDLAASMWYMRDLFLWFSIPHQPLSAEMLLPLDSEKDVGVMMDLLIYSNCMEVYTSAKDQGEDDMFDFSFTQIAEDEREWRVGDMYDELEEKQMDMDVGEAANEEVQDDVSFHGDSSNLDSTESEVEPSPKKKKRRIPPPNPPFRLRKKGRYSMLRVRLHF